MKLLVLMHLADESLEVEPDFLTLIMITNMMMILKVCLLSLRPLLDLELFQKWFGGLLQTHGQDILRSKGIQTFRRRRALRIHKGFIC